MKIKIGAILFAFVFLYTLLNIWYRTGVNWYNFTILACLGYYFGYFLLSLWKNGISKSDSYVPKMLNLEFLRIVFTACIVLVHISAEVPFFSRGEWGVEFFFILSGFLFALTYDRTATLTEFIKKKIIRFLPLILFCAVIRSLFKNPVDFSSMLADCFFLTDTLYAGKSYVGPAWYISILFWVTCLFYYLLKTHHKESVFLVIGVLTFFAYMACTRFGWGGPNGLGSKDNFGWLIPQALMRGVGGIGAGFFVAQFYLSQNKKNSPLKPWHYTVLELFLLIMPCVCMFNKRMFPSNPIMLIICFIGLLYLFVIKKGAVSLFLEKPVFAKISRYMLSVYLSHQTITFPLLIKYNQRASDFSSVWYGILVYFTAACLIGVIVHHTIELPATRFLKKWTA